MKAIILKDEQKVRALIKPGVNVNFTFTLSEDQIDWPPLHIAVGVGAPNIVRTLLEHGADPNRGDKFGFTPLMMASTTGMLDIIELLFTAGSDPNVTIEDDDHSVPTSALICTQAISDPALREETRALLRRHGATEALGFSEAKGQTLIHATSESASIKFATAEARRTLDHFCDCFRKQFGENHSVKIALFDDSKDVEHVWYEVLEMNDEGILGTLASDPVNVSTPLDPRRRISFDEINDWYYLKDKQMYGNFTLRVSLPHMESRQRQVWQNILAEM